MPAKPKLLVISAPSGGGKSVFCDRILSEFPNFVYSVSCTTREPRGAEVDGEDYLFMSRAGFMERVARDEFLEYATVHGNLYGTLEATVRGAIAEGLSVVLDIDVEGTAQIREKVKACSPDDPLRSGFMDIFLLPPSLGELRRRLVGRGEDAPETIELRLKNAEEEIKSAGLYRHQIVNDDLERAYAELRSLLVLD